MHHRILSIILYVNILNYKTLVSWFVLHVSFSVKQNESIIANNELGKVEKVVTMRSKEKFQNLSEVCVCVCVWWWGTEKINNDPLMAF